MESEKATNSIDLKKKRNSSRQGYLIVFNIFFYDFINI